MKALYKNILERFDQIINDTGLHIHDFIDDPYAFTRICKFDTFTVLKMTINMQGNCLSKEIDDTLDDKFPAKTRLNNKYFAFDGTDLDQLWKPKRKNRILVKNNQSYC